MAAPEDISENETLPLPIGNKQCGREHKKINKQKKLQFRNVLKHLVQSYMVREKFSLLNHSISLVRDEL